jgi:hypothetical protein
MYIYYGIFTYNTLIWIEIINRDPNQGVSENVSGPAIMRNPAGPRAPPVLALPPVVPRFPLSGSSARATLTAGGCSSPGDRRSVAHTRWLAMVTSDSEGRQSPPSGDVALYGGALG